MIRHFVVGFIVAAAAAGFVACGTPPDSQPTQPTATSAPIATTSSDATVDGFVGAWSPDTGDGASLDFDGPENTADRIIPDGVCRFVEFRVDREPDSRSAKIAFAARCANARIRGVGAGQLNEGILHWRARGVVALASGEKCEFKFVEGNKAVRVPEGLKVHYDGVVCDVAVAGTQLVKKKP
jgi:hypothetical protein